MYDIPFLKPTLVKKEAFLSYIDSIEATHLYSNYGPLNQQFEQRVLQEIFNGKGSAVTVHNATVGLMLAIAQSKRPGGKYALMPSFTFAATPLAAQWCGLEPYFLDIEPDTWELNKDQLEDAVSKLGDQIAVCVPYATFGTAMDLSPYHDLVQHGIPVVIDAAASFGTTETQTEEQFGTGFPGAVVFSFHATKSFGVGEGGLVYSADHDLIQRIRQAGNFGFSRSRESVFAGLNSKISEYTAAIALATLNHFGTVQHNRKSIHKLYLHEFDRTGLLEQGWSLQTLRGSVVHQFISVLSPTSLENRDVVHGLDQKSIEARTYFSPACHQQKQFKSCPHASLQMTEHMAKHIVSLPLWEEMDIDHINKVVRALAIIERDLK